ncbi:MAG: type I restriction enzyme endonuclease domain-containing protein [Actinoallomurus sp.]
MARDDVQAKLRPIIKRLLARHGYPPEEEKDAIERSSASSRPSQTCGPRHPTDRPDRLTVIGVVGQGHS